MMKDARVTWSRELESAGVEDLDTRNSVLMMQSFTRIWEPKTLRG